MNILLNRIKERKEKSNFILYDVLKIYSNSNFAVQQKARVFYNICIAAIFGLVLLTLSSSYVQITGIVGKIVPQIIVPEIILVIIFFYCIRLLKNGNYNFSTHLFMVSSNITVWYIMLINKGDLITQFDTVVVILALINVIPLFIIQYRWTVFFYVALNIALLFIFVFINRNQPGIDSSIITDYLADTSIALIFSGLAAYQIIKINNLSLEQVELDYKKRLIAETNFKESESRYSNLFENAQIGIYQTNTEGEILQANPSLIKMLGFKTFEELKKRNLETNDVFVQSSRKVFKEKIEKQGFVKDFESLWRKKDDELIIVRENSRIVRNKEGNSVYYEGFVENITEHKETEKALKESEEKYRTLMENLNDVIMMVDNDDRVLYVNKKFTEKFGYTSNEIIGKIGYQVLVDKKNHDSIKKANQERLKKETSHYELQFIAKNGTIIDFLISGAPVVNNEGKTIGSIGAMVDITDRKNAEKALRESEKKFRDMADLLPVAIWETDLEGICTYTNKVGYEIHNYTYEDFLSNINVLSLLISEDRRRASDNLKGKILGEKKIGEEYTGLRKDGSTFPVRIYTSVIFENNIPIGFRGVTVDITQVKEAEKELKESEERYRTIIEAFPDIIMISDLNGNIVFGNSSLERITGISQKDYSNPNRSAHIHPDDLHLITKAINELLASTKTHTNIIENRFIDTWGNIHWFSGIMSKLILNDQIFLQTITRDITEKKNIEKELEKHRNNLELLVQERTEELAAANEELVSTNDELHNQREELEAVLTNLQNAQKQLIQAEKMASLGVLAAGVAHEINNPLNFIKGGVVGLENYFDDNLKEYKDEVAPLLEGINVGVERAAAIVTSLNHYNRRDDLPGNKCNIHSIIDNCLVMLQNQTKHKIDIIKNYTTETHVLMCNEGKLHQVILNILTNAVQAIIEKGIITIKTNVIKDKIEIAITDSGCGISDEVMSKILDPFFTTKEPGKGTGLGLSITYNILQEQNGTIEFESKPNIGTIVTIKLPLNKTEK